MTNLINEQADQEIDKFLAQWKEKQKKYFAYMYKYWSEKSYKDMSYDENREDRGEAGTDFMESRIRRKVN